MQSGSVYRTAMYLRLSKDDKELSGREESNSIHSQRELLKVYIKDHEDMELCGEYTDDGYSGANFDRPEFKRMMEDVYAGHIDCIVVKDLSRLGRDYIEAGKLLQKTFPAFCVRFIAVADGFDSLYADYRETSLVLPMKNFMNDSYCRDISQKVKSHQKVKREKGEFIGAFAVYGYQKSPDNKNNLIIDPYAAKIVKKIYEWKKEGMSTLAIAEKLNGNGILSPMEYKRINGEKYSTGFGTNAYGKWSAVAVKRILQNEIYTGTMVQGKAERVNYKVKKSVKKQKEQWVRVENTHQPIIGKEDFAYVQKLLTLHMRAGKGMEKVHLLSGFLYCADCARPLIRRKNRYKGTEKIYYICSTKNKGLGCTRHCVTEEEIKELLKYIIQYIQSIILDKEKSENIKEKGKNIEIQECYKEIKKLEAAKEKYRMLKNGLAEDLKSGVLTEEDFQNFGVIYEERYRETEKAIKRQKLWAADMEKEKRAESISKPLQINRSILNAFFSGIYVREDKRIQIIIKNGSLF